jgi:hypothetical protein
MLIAFIKKQTKGLSLVKTIKGTNDCADVVGGEGGTKE